MIKLIKPSKVWEKEIFDYKKEMIANGEEHLNGCGFLENFDTFEDWENHYLAYAEKNKIPTDSSYVEGSQWMLVDENRKRVLGMINIRHELNEYLYNEGGHIGYSIRPSERRKNMGRNN